MRHCIVHVATGTLVLAGLSLAAPADAATHTCAGKKVTILGTPGNDHINGTRRGDVIDGLGGADVINGLGGNDTICGGYGDDDLRGNAGNDRLYGGMDGLYGLDFVTKDGDTLRGGSGNDTLVPGVDPRGFSEVVLDSIKYDNAPHALTADLGQGTATGDGTDRLVINGDVEIVGTPYADHIVGSQYTDWLLAGKGADHVWGAGGNDWIDVDGGGTTGHDADLAFGGPGNDRMTAAGGDDRLVGGVGTDDLTDNGATSTDVLEGGDGNDRLTDNGTSGAGSMLGQAGNDVLTVRVHPGTGTVDGGPDADVATFRSGVSGSPSASLDTASGHVVVDTPTPIAFDAVDTEAWDLQDLPWVVSGSAGPDFVDGAYAAGVDMTGSSGDDTLVGSDDADTFDGGPDQDCFQRGSTGGADMLTNVEVTKDGAETCPWID